MEIAKVELKVLEDGVKQADSQAIAHLSDLELALVGGGGGDIVWT